MSLHTFSTSCFSLPCSALLLHTSSYANKLACCCLLFWQRECCWGSDMFLKQAVCLFLFGLICCETLADPCDEDSSCRTCVFWTPIIVPWKKKTSSLNHSFIHSRLLLCSTSYRTLLCLADFANEWTHCQVSHCWTDCCISIHSDWDTMESRLAFITWHAHY